MANEHSQPTIKPQYFSLRNIDSIPQLRVLPDEQREDMKAVAQVLPFRVNNYVINELIDWDQVPDDPIFQLTFPQPGMLNETQLSQVKAALRPDSTDIELAAVVRSIRAELNPHPEGQLTCNVPRLDGEVVAGVQHKYRETCLVFPSAGQTCHSYCTFCFRWAQFVGDQSLKFATDESMRFQDYLRQHTEITDVLLTGGDPMVMNASMLARYVEPLLGPEFSHIHTIRIGTKSLSYWPYRYLTDRDSGSLLHLLKRVVACGKHIAIMAHFNHANELRPRIVADAIARIQATGAIIRTQSPIVRPINDNIEAWVQMWQQQVSLGLVPYYMFVERDTGAKHYFRLPLERALQIYREATSQVSGIARTARGPVMSALPGKVAIDGIAEINGQKVFVLSFLQARNPAWCKQPFFARFDPEACWLNDLRPAFGEPEFFFESELRGMFGVSKTSEGAAPSQINPVIAS